MTNQGTNLHAVSREWATRPDDQRFLTLGELKQSVLQRKNESWTAIPSQNGIRALPHLDGVGLELYDPTAGEKRMLNPTHWGFNQFCHHIKAPAAYLRTQPATLACINLQWSLETAPQQKDVMILAQSNGHHKLRAITGANYGRIWDHQVVEAVEKANSSGRWQIPAASYTAQNPRRATTLYASDRDIFIFLCDPKNPVVIPARDGNPEETLFRGFYTWNTEVGGMTFGLCTFLYRYCCDNRIVWGATEVKELRIRHTSGAPDRFAYEGEKYLKRYAEESTQTLVNQITAAKNTVVPLNEGKGETIESWLRDRGFTKGQATAAVDNAVAEEGQARTIWDVINGVTAYARSVSHTDERVQLEANAGKLMQYVRV